MIEINGSYGEGGGQILRSALTLSIITQQSFVIYDIRKKRKKPGLRPQHLVCVRAAKAISQARTKGDDIGSLELEFYPGCVRGGIYKFDIGSAGSTGLLFQTIVLPLLMAREPSFLEIRGGTHVPWSPCYHYINDVYGAVLREMGGSFSLTLRKWGFYPKGGGVIEASIRPSKLRAISIEREGLSEIYLISAASLLPSHVAQRQVKGAMEILTGKWSPSRVDVIEDVKAESPGSVLFAWTRASRRCYAGFTGLGRRGLPAEQVGKGPSEMLIKFLESSASVDSRLSDQLIIPALFSGSVSEWFTDKITKHFITNVWLIKQFGYETIDFFQIQENLHKVRIVGV